MKNIYSVSLEELQEVFSQNKIGKFRAKQVWNWLYVNLVNDFESMNNIDKKTRSFLAENYEFMGYEIIQHQNDGDKTEKILVRLNDNETIETVLMKYKHGYSVCVTTQIGCRIGCSFCASHLGGFKRDLSSGEIVAQVIMWEKYLREEKDDRVKTVVVMGIGEPFDNYDNVIGFIDNINHQDGLKIGARNITISTAGIVPKIYDLAEYDKQINLAISLHASNDVVRSSIMKINDTYTISDLIKAVNVYIEKTNRRVSFEYIMLRNINDERIHAHELVELLRGINCHVNLIPFNKVEEYDYTPSERDKINEFRNVLDDAHIQVTVRRTKGDKIDGACGQLRQKNEN